MCELLYGNWEAKRPFCLDGSQRCHRKNLFQQARKHKTIKTERKKTPSECHVLSFRLKQGMDIRMPRHQAQLLKRTQKTRPRADGEESGVASQEIKTCSCRRSRTPEQCQMNTASTRSSKLIWATAYEKLKARNACDREKVQRGYLIIVHKDQLSQQR